MGYIAVTRKDGSKAILSDSKEDFIRSRNRVYPESMRWIEIRHFESKKEAENYVNGKKPVASVAAVPKMESNSVAQATKSKGGNRNNQKSK